MQDLLKFVPGRGYRAFLMPKGKGADKKSSRPYVREQRKMMVAEKEEEKKMSPESHKKLIKFLKDQTMEISDFVCETDEERFRGQTVDSDDEEVMEVDDVDNDLDNGEMMESDDHISDISDDDSDNISELDEDSDNISEIDEDSDNISEIEL